MTQKTKDDFPSREEWEAEQAALRSQQGLSEGQTPEQRPQAFASGPTGDDKGAVGTVQQRLRDEGSNLADTSGEDRDAYAEAKAAAKLKTKTERGAERLFPGAHAYINNPDGDGKEHHGRAVAVNGVHEFKSAAQEVLANSGYNHDRRYAQVKSYECSTRDGRAELLIVSAEHLSKVPVTEFHRTPT